MNKKYKFLVTWIDKDNNYQQGIKIGVASRSEKCVHNGICENSLQIDGDYELHARRDVIHNIVGEGGYVKSITKFEGKEEGLAGA